MFKTILLDLITQALETEIRALLNTYGTIHGTEKQKQLEAAIVNSFALLKDITDKTKTKLDDTFVQIVLNSIQNYK